MTGREAQEKLQKPIFGDESHIKSLKVYRQLARLKEYRENGDEIDMEHLKEFYAEREIPKPEALAIGQLLDEIHFWEWFAYQEEE